MNLILLTSEDFIRPERVLIDGRRFAHISSIHRAREGDRLRVGLLGGKLGHGTVIRLSEASVELEVELHDDPPPPLNLTLLLALPRPKFLKRVIEAATGFGVKQIYLINSYRVEKVYWSCAQISEDSLHQAMLLGLEQARDTVVPEIHVRRLFKPFVEDELPSLIKNSTALVAHPGANELCPYQISKTPVTLAIGPEGGFIEYELQKLTEVGMTPVRTFDRILKVETALASLIGRLM